MQNNKSIIILDEVLDNQEFEDLKNYCFEEKRFTALEKGDHIYYVANAPDNIIDKINQILEKCKEIAVVELQPKFEGSKLICRLAPQKTKVAN